MPIYLSQTNKESVGGTVHFSGAGCVFGIIRSDQIRSVAQSCPTLGLNPCFPLTIFFFFLSKVLPSA